ncbi:MAG TPA: hypothetical protein VM686_31045 [Polyangiaceae bacterium]|nr:hypothetical protein [Polyangiaceae bacterium]
MTLADDLKPIVYSARAIAGTLGFRVHSVAIVIAETDGEHTGDGVRAETVTAITEDLGQPPRVKWLNDEEIALGQLGAGAIEVGPITPLHNGNGTELATLTGADMTDGQVRLLRITGPNHPSGADYRITSVSADRPLRYMIRAVPVGTQAG